MNAFVTSLCWTSLLGASALALSCNAAPTPRLGESGSHPHAPVTLEDGEGSELRPRMQWTPADDPTRMLWDLTYEFSKLPMAGEPKRQPWPGYYWSTAGDGINLKWQGPGTLSPAGKYATALGLDVAEVEDAVSAHYGVDSHSHRPKCTEHSECNAKIGEMCAKRDGEESGHCIPTWFGICHAWAPAAIRYEEPKYAVTRGGVEFQPNDIKALISLIHDKHTSDFVSLRCNGSDAAGEIKYDEYGRPVMYGPSAPCIDTNPGTLLVVLANKMGLKGESFVYDRTFDDQVWNQPLSRYEVTDVKTVSAQKANELIGVFGRGSFDESEKASIAQGDWQHFGPYSLTAGKKMLASMKGTGDADLYLRAGEQPTAREFDCRPYAAGSSESCEYEATADTEVYVSVYGSSSTDITLRVRELGEVPETYFFNDEAAEFRALKMKVAYITESPATAAGPLSDAIERFVRAETYSAIIELNGEGSVIGGEWTGDSKQHHPDFLWSMREAIGKDRIAGGLIKWDEVMSLYEESIKDPAGADDAAPVTEPTDADETVPADDATPVTEPTDADDATPVASPTDTDELTDADDATPVAEPTDADDATPVAEPTDANETLDADEPTDADDATPVTEPTPVASPTDTDELTDADDATPVTEPTPVASPTDVDEPTAVASPTDTDEPTPVASPVDADEPTPADDTTDADEATDAEQPSTARRLVRFSESVAPNAWQIFGPYPVEPGERLTARLNVRDLGQADLYVRGGKRPHSWGHKWDCREKAREGDAVTCTAEGSGEYYVGVRGHTTLACPVCVATQADFTLDVAYSAAAGADD